MSNSFSYVMRGGKVGRLVGGMETGQFFVELLGECVPCTRVRLIFPNSTH